MSPNPPIDPLKTQIDKILSPLGIKRPFGIDASGIGFKPYLNPRPNPFSTDKSSLISGFEPHLDFTQFKIKRDTGCREKVILSSNIFSFWALREQNPSGGVS